MYDIVYRRSQKVIRNWQMEARENGQSCKTERARPLDRQGRINQGQTLASSVPLAWLQIWETILKGICINIAFQYWCNILYNLIRELGDDSVTTIDLKYFPRDL